MRSLIGSYPRVMWGLAVALVISAVGESFLWPLTTTYLVESFGTSLHVAALVLMLQYTGTLIGNVCGGMLFDRWSGRKTVIVAIVLSILYLVLMGTIHSFSLYVGLLFLLGICQGTFWPSSRAFAAVLWPEGGRAAMNMLYVANNLGVAIGAAVGGLVASTSFRLAFYGNSCAYLIFLLIFVSIIKERDLKERHLARQAEAKQAATEAVEAGTGQVAVATKTGISTREWVSLLVLIFGLMLLVLTYSQWQTTISNYVISLGISLKSYSVLWAINGLVIVLCQPILSWAIRRYTLSLKGQILVGGCFFALAMLAVSLSTLYAAFVVGMVIVTWGEMMVWPAVPAIAAEMAPLGREGFFQGLATTGQSIGRMLGPLVGSMLYESYSAHVMLVGMIVLTVAAWVCFLNYDRFVRGKKSFPVVEQQGL